MNNNEQRTKDDQELRKEEDFQNQKKKKISIVEVNEFLSRKQSEHRNVDSKNRRSTSTDKTSSKAYSFKCDLDDSLVASALPSSGNSGPRHCPSDNVGVRSMSIEVENVERLGPLEAVAFAVFLREAADALGVLRRTVRQLDAKELQRSEGAGESRTVVRKKNSCASEDEKMMLYGRDAGFLPAVLTIGEKLLNDKDLAYNVFRKVACELEHNDSYNWFRCEVNAIAESKEKECNLEINLKIWADLAMRLRESQKTFEKEFEEQKKKYIEDSSKLAAEIDTSYCDNVDKLDYISRWETAKLEQQNLRLSLQEQSLLTEMKEQEKTKKIDTKVSETLQTYGRSVINNYEDEISVWSTRYNDELERRQQETTELQEKIDEIKEFLQESYNLQKERQSFIDEYMEEQEKVKAEIDYWNAVNTAATLIQSVWRGYMVRHGLGRFAELKKLKQKAKKSKKKSKKKAK